MNKPAKDPQNRFECTGVTVHFIYSFALGKKLRDSEDEQYDPIDASTLVNKKTIFKLGTPTTRRGIKQYLTLQEDTAWKKLPAFCAEVVPGTKNRAQRRSIPICEVQIEPLVRVFQSGATCCFKVQLCNAERKLFSLETIHAVLGLVQQRENKPTPSLLRLARRGRTIALHSLFYDNIRKLVKFGGDKKSNLAWLDVDRRYIKNKKGQSKNESQTPWVVTIAEVQGETARVFCGQNDGKPITEADKEKGIVPFEQEVASILYRSVNGIDFVIEPGYVNTPMPWVADALRSHNLDARLHVAMSNRSVLCICRDQEATPADYFMPDLLDVCEMLRARWHMLTIMNRCLDNVLSELQSPDWTAERKMRRVLNARTWLARLLEDSELYRVSGDALASISWRLKETFREAALRRLLLDKAELVERIREGIGELDWLSRESRYRGKRQKTA